MKRESSIRWRRTIMVGLRWLTVACLLSVATPALALEHVSFERDGQAHHVSGRVLVKAEDGGLLLQDAQSILWAVQPDELQTHRQDGVPFEPLSRAELAQKLLEEMPDGFRIHETSHYLICYNTSPAYAQWCGALYERLYMAFTNYWTHRGFELREPEMPLVALVFDSQQSYAHYARQELGEATDSIVGYYSLRTNRVNMYDLTGSDGVSAAVSRGSSAAHINRLLSRPGAERTVATVIHEATHQLAFNCGLQTRYADIPLWVSEGIAVYFETPDLNSSRGWRSIGSINRVRLLEFRRYLRSRPANSLHTLIANDDRFRNARTAPDAYAEAWALNYFLLRTRPNDYLKYLESMSQKEPLLYDDPEQRMAQFRAAFGSDLQELDAELLRYMSRLRL